MPGNRIPEIDSRAEAPVESAFHGPPGLISELQAHRHFSGIPISRPTKATVDNSTPPSYASLFPARSSCLRQIFVIRQFALAN